MRVGLMLDTVRSFIPLEELHERISTISKLGYTTLHLHLTDDQGWRVQSDIYPHLASEDHYTKDEIRELVEFATAKGIEIIPEVDVPGHSSYLNYKVPGIGLGTPAEPPIGEWVLSRRKSSVIDVSNPEAMSKVGKLIEEVAELFSGDLFHIGFDEVNKRYFKKEVCVSKAGDCLERALTFFYTTLQNVGKRPVMWVNEMKLHYKNHPNLILQVWSSQAAKILDDPELKNDVILSNTRGSYFNFPMTQSEMDTRNKMTEGVSVWKMWQGGGLLRPELIKAFNTPKVLGYEACLWTEYLQTEEIRTIALEDKLPIFINRIKEIKDEINYGE